MLCGKVKLFFSKYMQRGCQPQLKRAQLAGEKLANSRGFRARVVDLAGESCIFDSPRYSPQKNSHRCSPVTRGILATQDMSEPGKNRDQIAKIMSSAKRDRSPSVELVDTESPDEKNSEEDECTESEQELSTSQNEPQSRQTSTINTTPTNNC